MEAVFCIVGILIGAGIVGFLLSKRNGELKASVASLEARVQNTDSVRQKLEVDLATLRVQAEQAASLTVSLQQSEQDVSRLNSEKSSLSATISEREKALANEKGLFESAKNDLKDQLAISQEAGRQANERITNLEKEISASAKTIEERESALKAEREQLTKVTEEFKTHFAALSAAALKENSEVFISTATKVLELHTKEAENSLEKRETEIQQLIKPIQEGLKAVGEATKQMEVNREKAFGTIEEQLKLSVQQSAEVARQASGLKDALKKPNVRGRWGEVQLRNCIELAGMEEHCDVEFQETSVSHDDERIRPDMTVRMPGGRKIAVDAKTPMEHFLQYIEATTDDERNAALLRHGRATKNHVNDLAKSDYMQKVAESPDFVVMFLPNESFLAMALEKAPDLIEDALNKKILITTPGTLIGLLKVIRYGWNEQKIAVNAQRIADEGAKLNTEIHKFLEDFAKIGSALKVAADAYDSGLRRVEKQITNSSNKLTQLGAKTKKALTAKASKLLAPGESSESEVLEVVAEDVTIEEDV